ncbi:MAG: hypothetical protein FRX48_04185 [Lasallia pustulata]|uniref:Uncharacterized protein n=1 Tax=Lasallia pustulata TaxID=136370 RepID=A0A5M8PSM5_9LECA|nr:MAG: hypothetical protein FRX48_04185 [Lasallia pustulata]
MRSYEVLATPRTDTYHAFMFVMKEWQLGKRDLANRPHGLALRALGVCFVLLIFDELTVAVLFAPPRVASLPYSSEPFNQTNAKKAISAGILADKGTSRHQPDRAEVWLR